jgi:DNA repair photolyase
MVENSVDILLLDFKARRDKRLLTRTRRFPIPSNTKVPGVFACSAPCLYCTVNKLEQPGPRKRY